MLVLLDKRGVKDGTLGAYAGIALAYEVLDTAEACSDTTGHRVLEGDFAVYASPFGYLSYGDHHHLGSTGVDTVKGALMYDGMIGHTTLDAQLAIVCSQVNFT